MTLRLHASLRLACLAATASTIGAGMSTAAQHQPCSRYVSGSRCVSSSRHSVQRSRRIFAQYQQQPGTPQLLPGWETYQDEHGQVYYGNVQTGETRWEAPTQYGEPPQQDPYGAQYQQQQQQYQQQQQQYQQPQEQYGGAGEDDATTVYVSERLQEPQLRIVRAVVHFLGSETALDLLAQTEQVQAAGGMIVAETGKPRTSGGVYLTLLRDASNLPREAPGHVHV